MTASVGMRTYLWCPLLLLAYFSGTGQTVRDARSSLGEHLRARALREESPRHDRDDWDHGVNLALSVRARVELVRGGMAPAGSADEKALIDRAWTAAQQALEYEAASLRARGTSGLDATVRGWGTRKPLSLGGISVPRAIDAYSTGTALGALADLAWLLDERHDRRGRDLTAKLEPIAAHWLGARRFAAPGGPAFDKIALPHPEVRQHVVHNTDALFGRALLSLSHAARLEGDATRAARYRELARAIANQIRQNLLERVLRDDRVSISDWTYELVRRGDAFQPHRPEDSNHASYLLDFLAAAATDHLDGDASWLSARTIADLGATLSQVIVRRRDGSAAFELFVNPAEVRDDARGKKRAAGFVFAADEAHPERVASWWRELAGSTRTLDLGLSIRTSWGWTRAVRDRPDLLSLIGQSLLASDRPDLPLNLFLAQAVFWRESGGLAQER